MAGCVPNGNPARGRDVACYVRRPVVFLKSTVADYQLTHIKALTNELLLHA